jgi:hypothetical protein
MTNPIRAALDKAAEELWREAGRLTQVIEKPESWAERSEELKQKWRRMAAVGSNAFLRALPDLSVCPRLACNYNGSGDSSATLADAVIAAAKEERE